MSYYIVNCLFNFLTQYYFYLRIRQFMNIKIQFILNQIHKNDKVQRIKKV